MLKAFYTLITISFIFSFSTFPAMAKRIALIIGNNDYQEVSKLNKAVNDARAVAASLEKLHFKVILKENQTRRDMILSINELTRQIETGDEVLFYFAGHGVEINGRNYLLATDISKVGPGSELLIESDGFPIDRIISNIQTKGSRLNIMILDACRINPFDRDNKRTLGSKRGLARINPPRGSFIMYSAGAKEEALDHLGEEDSNPNSVYTRRLLPLLKTPGLSLSDMARRVRTEVTALAKTVSHDQYPAYYDELNGEFYFTSSDTPPPETKYDPNQDINNDRLKDLQKKLRKLEQAQKETELRRKIAEEQRKQDELRRLELEEARRRARQEREEEEERRRKEQEELTRQREEQRRRDEEERLRNRTSYWNHNGSTMRLRTDGTSRWFYYVNPRSGLRSYHVSPGTLLFNGRRNGNQISGTARIFTKRCGVYSYHVSGYISGNQTKVTMNGQAPIVNRNCRIVRYKYDHLVFDYLYSR